MKKLLGAIAVIVLLGGAGPNVPPSSTVISNDGGTKTTASVLSAGGSGLTGWLSDAVTSLKALVTALGSPFQAGGSIGNTSFAVGQPMHRVSTTITTPAGVTYTGATTAAPLAICATATPTICVPMTVTLSATQTNDGYLTRLVLQKSTTGATAASFRLIASQTALTMTGIYDASAYTVAAADVLSGARMGVWECPAADANLMTFECSPTASSGWNDFNVANGTIYLQAEATAAYVRATGETFTVIADVSARVP